MSIHSFRREKRQQGQFLPSPNDFSSDLSLAVRAANQLVSIPSSEPPNKRRKVGERHDYSPKMRASIGQYTALHGPKRVPVKFVLKIAQFNFARLRHTPEIWVNRTTLDPHNY